MKKRFLIISLMAFLLGGNVYSQDSIQWSTSIQAGTDLMSRYIWRGLNLGGAGPSIEPSLSLDVGNAAHTLSLGAWSAYTFSASANEEIDLLLTYSYKSLLTLTVTDYFFPGYNTGRKNKYFCYSSDSTGHVFEGMAMFNGTDKVPFTFMVATNFFGNDARKMEKVNDTTFVENGLQYSTYIELGFFKTIKAYDLNIFAGGTINHANTDRHESCYYGNSKAGFTNIGIKVTRTIPITESLGLPIQASLIANPMQNMVFLVFGISI